MPTDPQLERLSRELDQLRNEFNRGNFTAAQDFNKISRFNARLKVPTYASEPATCEIGELYVNSGTGELYVCSASNTWSLVGTQT